MVGANCPRRREMLTEHNNNSKPEAKLLEESTQRQSADSKVGNVTVVLSSGDRYEKAFHATRS